MAPAADAPPHLTIDLTGLAKGAEDGASFHDPLARNLNLAPDALATDQNCRATLDGRFLVISKVCTHLKCVVLGDTTGKFGGFFCPCHSGHFDKCGRIRRGPPMQNLPIPVLEWQDPGLLTLFPPSYISKTGLDLL